MEEEISQHFIHLNDILFFKKLLSQELYNFSFEYKIRSNKTYNLNLRNTNTPEPWKLYSVDNEIENISRILSLIEDIEFNKLYDFIIIRSINIVTIYNTIRLRTSNLISGTSINLFNYDIDIFNFTSNHTKEQIIINKDGLFHKVIEEQNILTYETTTKFNQLCDKLYLPF